MIKKSFLVTFLLFICTIQTNLEDRRNPQKIGLLTVTHQRTPGNTFFKSYLKRYAEMDCDIIEQISIVWNNNYTVEQSDIYDLKPNWKIPIYFYKTQFNSMSLRFQLPKQSKAQVFFVIDDDIFINCNQLKNGFKKWKQNSVDAIAPLTGYVPRSQNIIIQTGQMQYYPRASQYYTFILVGATFISRDFINLYNSQNLQAKSMIQYARDVKNCDDLMMNFLVSKYYPHQIPKFIDPLTKQQGGEFRLTDGPNAVSKDPNHLKIRNQCLKKYTKTLGQMPLVINKKNVQKVQLKFWKLPKQLDQQIKYLASELAKKDIIKKQLQQFTEAQFFKKLGNEYKKYEKNFQQLIISNQKKKKEDEIMINIRQLRITFFNFILAIANCTAFVTLVYLIKKQKSKQQIIP